MLKRSQCASIHAAAAAATSWRNTRKTLSTLDPASARGRRGHDFANRGGGIEHVALLHRRMHHEDEAGFAQLARDRQALLRRESGIEKSLLEVHLAATAFPARDAFGP